MHKTLTTPGKSLLAAAIAAVLAAQNAQALSFTPSDEVTVDWDTTLSYTAAWRTSSQDDDLLADINGDDGNRNFDKGAMINNRLSILSEMNMQYQDAGLFLRGSAFYDDAYFGENDHDNPASVNSLSVPAGSFTDDTKGTHGKDARLLDAFVYGNFDVADRNLSVRIGQQVVQWGESMFMQGVSAGQGPVDGTKANLAGVEVKDIYLPVGQIYVEFDVTNNLSVGAYSQWEWKKTEMDASGSYFSVTDVIDEGGEQILLPDVQALLDQTYQGLVDSYGPLGALIPEPSTLALTRGEDIDASDSGQWGVAFNYFADNIGEGVDFGLYYLNYHEKKPLSIVRYGEFEAFSQINPALDPTGTINPTLAATNAGFSAVPVNYRLEFFENIKLIGASFSTNVGETNVGGEIHQKKGATVLDADGMAHRADTMQVQFNMVHSLGVTALADDTIIAAEIGYNKVLDLEDADLDDTELLDDKSGSGMAATVSFNYNNVLPATNLSVPVSINRNFNNSAAGTFVSARGDRMSVSADFTYKDNMKAGISYNAYFGEANNNQLTDRDFVSLNLKYSF